jgi:hypothetical protein
VSPSGTGAGYSDGLDYVRSPRASRSTGAPHPIRKLPLDGRIKAGNAVHTVADLAGHIEWPDGLPFGFICYFYDTGVVRASGQKAFIKLNVAVAQQFDTPQGCSIRQGNILLDGVCSSCGLVNLEKENPAVTAGLARCSAR